MSKRFRFGAFALTFAVALGALLAVPSTAQAAWKGNSRGTWWTENSAKGYATGWRKISGKWYWFDGSGWMGKNRWVQSGGKWYYLGKDGAMLVNTTTPDGYKVGKDGAWMKGGAASGSSSSSKKAGWVKSGSRWWYRNADGSYPKNAIVKIGGKSYGFDSAGWMVTGWRKFSGKWHYFSGSGAMLVNATTPDGYKVDKDGVWVRGGSSSSSTKAGWVKTDGKWRYRLANGSFIKDALAVIDGKTYFFDARGWMATGWQKSDGKWYYFGADGIMARNTWVDGGMYYVGADGVMYANAVTPDGTVVDASGRRTSTPIRRKAKYSYAVYQLNECKAFYTGYPQALFIKTDNRNRQSIKLESNMSDINVYANKKYHDLNIDIYRYEMNDIVVDGGYITTVFFSKPGKHTMTIKEGGTIVGTFTIDVKDSNVESDRWIDKLIADHTTSGQTPPEKMDAICSYLLRTFRYNEAREGGKYLFRARTADTPYFVSKRWDSYVSPAVLCRIAERIGGFEDIHNCYGDHPMGSAGWYADHYFVKVRYQGEQYRFAACPSVDSGVMDSYPMIDLGNTGSFRKLF